VQLGFTSAVRTVLFSLAAALVFLPVIKLIQKAVQSSEKLSRIFINPVLALLFITPGVLTGVLLNRFWFHKWSAFIYTSFVIVLFGILIQYLYPLVFCKNLCGPAETSQVIPGKSRIKDFLKKASFVFSSRPFVILTMAAFLISMREFSSTVLLYPPGQETLLVKIYTMKSLETDPVLSGLVLFYLFLSAIPAAVILFHLKNGFKKN